MNAINNMVFSFIGHVLHNGIRAVKWNLLSGYDIYISYQRPSYPLSLYKSTSVSEDDQQYYVHNMSTHWIGFSPFDVRTVAASKCNLIVSLYNMEYKRYAFVVICT